jgi:hypothetical protein
MGASVVAKKIDSGTLAGDGKAGRIRRLVDYILAPESEDAMEKCVHWGEQGFASRDGQEIKEQMVLASERAIKSPDTVAHFVISWATGLAPSDAQVDDAARILLAALGADEHRAVWAAHANTDNVHVHVVLDRIHPTTGRALDLYRDVPKIHRAAKHIAETQNWGPTLDSRYTVEWDPTRDWEPALSQKALLMEHKTGAISAERYAQSVGPEAIRLAKDWEDLHRRLAQLGMSFAPQGSGAVIRVGATAVKASRVSRSASLARLEKSFGPYRAPGATPPASTPRQQLASEFIAAREVHQVLQRDQKKLLGTAQAVERKQLRDHFGKAYRDIVGDRSVPWLKRNLMRRVLAAQRAKAMAELVEKHRVERAALRRSQSRFPKYQDWARDKAQAARPVPIAQGAAAGGQAGAGGPRPEVMDIRGYTVSVFGDEVIYTRAGATRASMIDHGRALTIYEADDGAIRAMLQLANARWGGLQLNRAEPELKNRFAEIAAAEHFALYDHAGTPVSPSALQRDAPARPSTPRRP